MILPHKVPLAGIAAEEPDQAAGGEYGRVEARADIVAHHHRAFILWDFSPSAAFQIAAAHPSGLRRVTVDSSLQYPRNSSMCGNAASDRAFLAPKASKVAPAQRSMLARPSSGSPTSSETIETGRCRAHSLIASKLPCLTRRSTSASASASILGAASFSAGTVKGARIIPRILVCSGGSLVIVLPIDEFISSLAAIPRAEENRL